MVYDRYKIDNAWPTFALNLLLPGFGNFGWGSSFQGDVYGAQLEFDITVTAGGTGGILWVLGYYLSSALIGSDMKSILQTGGLVIFAGGVLGGYGTGLVRPFVYEVESNQKLRNDLGLPSAVSVQSFMLPVAALSF